MELKSYGVRVYEVDFMYIYRGVHRHYFLRVRVRGLGLGLCNNQAGIKREKEEREECEDNIGLEWLGAYI